MVKETSDKQVQVEYWAGTFDDLLGLIETARRLIEDVSGDVDVRVSITVERPGSDIEFESIDELRDHSTAGRLGDWTQIKAFCRRNWDLHVSLTIGRRRLDLDLGGISARVNGQSPVQVSGIADQIDHAFGTGRQHRPRKRNLLALLAVLESALLAGGFLLVGSSPAAAIVLFVLYLIAAGCLVMLDSILRRLVPVLEILPTEGAQTSLERSRVRLAGGFATFAIAVVAAVVGGIASR